MGIKKESIEALNKELENNMRKELSQKNVKYEITPNEHGGGFSLDVPELIMYDAIQYDKFSSLEESSNFIKKFNITNLNFKNYLNENYREKIKKRFFNERFKDLHTFHKVECIFPKMDAMNFALKENSNTLFIDADLVFFEEVEI